MADRNTLRVLSLDGGGIRGYNSAIFMDMFVNLWGINPAEIWKYFDIISGTSIGGVQAIAYGLGMTPATMQTFFLEEGPWIFTTSNILPGIRATAFDKIWAVLFGTSCYSNTGLINVLNEQFGTNTMADLNSKVVITSIDQTSLNLVLFSNVVSPYLTGQNYLAADVALSTSAAPIYFPPATLPDLKTYQDGGIWANNPVFQGISVGRMLKPNATRCCVLSLGTGRGDLSIDNIPPDDQPPFTPGIAATIELLSQTIQGPQEGADLCMKMQSNFIPFPTYYYRFQYPFPNDIDAGLDNTDPAFYEYMETATTSLFESDIDNITAFIGFLEN
jgi:hypothetical protein